VLGLRGLNYAKAHPETKGKTHAWGGIIAGGFFALVNIIGIGFAIFAGMAAGRHG